MAIQPRSVTDIFDYLVGDFESAWEAVAAQKGDHIPRCNFMFALLTMILLEFACRVCAKDQSGVELGKLTTALNSIEPRYFTPVPGAWGKPRGFVLLGPNPDPTFSG